jgi:hypothetical protein
VQFAKPLGNGMFMWRNLHSKKMLIAKFSAQIQMCVELVAQFVYHEIDNPKSTFILHRTKHLGNTILANLINFKSSWLKMVEAKKLHQIIMTKLSSLFSHKITLD